MIEITRSTMHTVGTSAYPTMVWRTLRPQYIIPDHWRFVLHEVDRGLMGGEGDCVDYAMWFKAEIGRRGINSVGVVIDDGAQHAYNIFPMQGAPGEGLDMVLYEPLFGRRVNVGQTTPDGKFSYEMREGMVLI